MTDDGDLVERLLAGDGAALSEWVAAFEPRLLRLVRQKAGEEDAQEIVQDTLIAALDSLPLFSGKSSLFSWLAGIARHEIADFYRKKRLKTIVFSKFERLEVWMSELAGPEGKLDEKELRRRIKMALWGLVPRQRQILWLKYVDGLSVDEVAGRLGMTFKATESALFRARRAFALVFEQI